MPFKSEKQRRYMWANHPEIAREWTDKYGSEPEDDEDDITMEARNKRVQEKGKERGQRKTKKSR